ncbi:YbfB/YjiJ family MFS transporter [Sedimentitalea sp.]|uniref:YbfB/YjiJ family MFS transporter n=1 Tax=Sedimentitalea sp. TaxID=2048915 RepID=UPI00329A38FD
MRSTGRPLQVHYAWTVAVICGLSVLCGLGLGRFAFGMMLPSISQDLGLNYSQAGMLGFGNLTGYLISVPLVPYFLAKIGTRITVTLSLLVMALSMLAMAVTHSFFWLTAFYFVAGLSSGAVVLPSMSVMAKWFAPSHRGLSSGIVMAGPGFGIILSGYAVPRLIPFDTIAAWQVGWLIFGALTAVVSLVAFVFIRNTPGDSGMRPFGRAATRAGVASLPLARSAKFKLLAHLGVIFSIYGATYMLYVTFIVTTMVDSYGMTEAQAGVLWSWFGFLSIFSGLLFGALSDRIGRRAGMVVAFGVLSLSFGLVGLGTSGFGLYLSVILFGISAWSIPVIMSASAGDYFGAAGAAGALAVLTLFFSAGQAVGPVIAGVLAEMLGNFSLSYTVSAAASVLAIGMILVIRPPIVID